MTLPRSFGPTVYAVGGGSPGVLAVREARPPDAPKPRLLDRVRDALRTRHYSRRTGEAYIAWIRRSIFFHGKRHPAELGGPEVTRFLSSLAVERRVAASTQNQALSALLFRYRDVLGVESLDCIPFDAVIGWSRSRMDSSCGFRPARLCSRPTNKEGALPAWP